MVSTGYTNVGEEWSQKLTYRTDLITRDTAIEVLLFDDSTDNTDDTSDIGDITTEPTSGNYARQTLTLDSSDITLSFTDGDVRAEGTVTFDTTDTTETVDAAGVVVDFQSDVVNSETSQNPHLISTSRLLNSDGNTTTADLSQFSSIDATVRLDLT